MLAAVMLFSGGATAYAQNANPTVTATRNPTGNTRVGVPVAFTATGADADGDTLTYSWNFGDSTTASDRAEPHARRSLDRRHVHRRGHGLRRQGRHGHRDADASSSRPTAPRRSRPATGRRRRPASRRSPCSSRRRRPTPTGTRVTYAWDLDGDGTFETTERRTRRSPTPRRGLRRVAARQRRVRRRGHAAPSTVNGPAGDARPDRPLQRARLLQDGRVPPLARSTRAIAAIKKLGPENNFTVDATEDAALFTDAFLSRYDLVVFNSTTGDVLNDTQQAAFERFIRAGHGYVGIHSATDTEYGWPWYGRLIGRVLPQPPERHADRDGRRGRRRRTPPRSGPAGALDARRRVVQLPGHRQPGGQRRRHRRQPARQTPIHVLLTMDESTYAEADGTDGVDDDHPIAWCKRYDGGRMFYTALGHTEATYTEPAVPASTCSAASSRGRATRPTPRLRHLQTVHDGGAGGTVARRRCR